MGRATVARALTARDRSDESRFDIRLAEPDDDRDIRRLLREYPLPGDVALTFEREPDSALAAGVEGDVHQTIIACEPRTGCIAAVASRSERAVFINGRVTRIGYLGQLRTNLRGRSAAALLDEGFTFCRELHRRGTVSGYLVSIVEQNRAARRLLCGFRSSAAPAFVPVGTLVTLAIPRGRVSGGRGTNGLEIRRGSIEMLEDIVDCLNRNGSRHQFAPVWTIDDLLSSERTPELAPEDFIVVASRGGVVGCAALWDQRSFKQVVVRGYSDRIARWRPWINLAGRLIAVPHLPDVGRALQLVCLSHVAADDDCAGVTAALIADARRRMPSDSTHLVMGFSEGSPLLATASRVARHRAYRSILYLACWPDGLPLIDSLDKRLPHPEVAIL